LLKVWLPLDGDLRNLGCSDVTVTNNGATVNSAGKIGKCYSPATITLTNLNNLSFNNSSYCFWAKTNSTASWQLIIGIDNSDNSQIHGIYIADSSRLKLEYNPSLNIYNAEIGSWHHYAFVVKDGKSCCYRDGVLQTTSSEAVTNDTIGRLRLGVGTSIFLNDVRIYDHCLSAAEVREIAMGLVLHYKLDASSEEKITIIPSTNVYSYPTFNTTSKSGGWSHWGPSGHSGDHGQNTNKKYIYNKNNTYSHWISEKAGTNSYILLFQSPTFEGGYRSLQAIIKEENGLPITESICCPTWNARNGGVPNDKWTSIKSLGDGFYYCCCEGASQDGSNDLIGIYVKSGYKIYVSECYLENNTETCSPIFIYSSNIIQDSSGYGHNGTIIGDLIINKETKRYLFSTKWNSSAPTESSETGICYIQTPFTLTTPLQLTVAWWAKPENGYGSSTNHAAFCTSNSTSRPTDYNTTALHHRDAGFDIYPSDGSGVKRLSFTYIRNEWHHYAITYDGTTAKSYKDGVLQTNISVGTNKTLATFSQLYIGYSQAGGVRRKTLGNYSDFRIYCTPLLDNDIKMLYNVGMKVDNLGGVHAFEFNEISNEKLLKTGILQTNELEETSTQLARLQKDKGWLSSEFIEI